MTTRLQLKKIPSDVSRGVLGSYTLGHGVTSSGLSVGSMIHIAGIDWKVCCIACDYVNGSRAPSNIYVEQINPRLWFKRLRFRELVVTQV